MAKLILQDFLRPHLVKISRTLGGCQQKKEKTSNYSGSPNKYFYWQKNFWTQLPGLPKNFAIS
jgi:hypothetical protein